jgi:uncharacterized protein YndB with AHSA1/START domain
MSDIKLDIVYPYPPGRVWRALTDPEALGEWLMPNDFQTKLGHKFQFKVSPKPRGWRGIVDCEVLELETERRLSYSWEGDPRYRPTIVTWILEPVEGGTRLRLEHTGFRGLGGFFLKMLLGRGWGGMLKTTLPAVIARITDAGLAPAPPGAETKRGCH